MLLVLVSLKICCLVELMTQRKKKNENFVGKEQSHNQQHLIQQGHRSIFSFVQSFEDKKKK